MTTPPRPTQWDRAAILQIAREIEIALDLAEDVEALCRHRVPLVVRRVEHPATQGGNANG